MTPTPRTLATYVAGRVLPALATMCLTFACIHALRPEDYAVYSLSLLSAGVAAGFVGGLCGQPLLRYAHELSPPALRQGLVGFPLLASALACLLVIGWVAWTNGVSASALLAVAAIPGLALVDARRSLFVAHGRAGAAFALDAWRAGLALLLALALLPASGGHVAAPLLAQGLALAACLWLVRPAAELLAPAGSRRVDAHYLAYGAGIAGWAAVIVAMSLAERATVTSSAGLAAAGRYAAQADVINAVFAAAGGALASAMMPAYLARHPAPSATVLRRLLGFGLLGVLAVAALCGLLGLALAWGGAAVGAGRIAQALTGDPRTGLALVAAGAVWMAAGFVQKPLELRGQTQRIFAGVVAALLLFLLIAPALAARFGPFGVALAKLAAGLLFCAITAFAGRAVGAAGVAGPGRP